MERFLQYLDDLDDLYGAIGLVWETLRRTLLKLISLPHGPRRGGRWNLACAGASAHRPRNVNDVVCDLCCTAR